MRTNIVIDDQLMSKAMEVSGLKTKRAVVEEGLRTLVRLKRQADILELRGKVQWEGDLDQMRRNRFDDR
jgi:Arc/MetJ family transcription regulator